MGRWDDYVAVSPESTFFHLSGWKTVLEKAFGHKTYFLYAESDGKIIGILPLAQVKSLLFGNTLVSTPFCVYGGIVADTQEAANQLRVRACELANDLKVDCLELRNTASSQSNWPQKDLYVTFRKAIAEDADAILKSIPNKQRAVVRKGIKAGLVSDEGWHEKEIYDVYSQSLRDLGTPAIPIKYFRVLREVFGDACRSLMIRHEGKNVAGVLSFYFKDQVLPYYAGSTPAARGVNAHGFMYWALMVNAREQGVDRFDFGRSKIDTGSYSFKKNWGFEPEPLHYEYYLVKSTSVPQVNPTNPKYRLFINAWKKLPLVAANTVGPILARNLG